MNIDIVSFLETCLKIVWFSTLIGMTFHASDLLGLSMSILTMTYYVIVNWNVAQFERKEKKGIWGQV